MKQNHIIALIVGESGSGKTTICDELSKRYGLKQVESYTTRPRRDGETCGHIFISENEMPDKSEMCAYTLYNGNHYFATHQQIDDADLYVIDPAGVEYFKKHYRGRKIPKVVYLYAPVVERLKRMAARGDTEQNVIRRHELDKRAFANVQSDVQIENADLDECVAELYYYLCEQEGKLIGEDI